MAEIGRLEVPETGETITTATRRLPVPGRPCEIVLHADEHDDITKSILEGRWTLPTHYDLLRAVGAAGRRVLDLGAHVGTFALFAAALGSEVLAIEASPRNAALLRASAARNAFTRLHVECTAVGAAPGSLEFLQAGPYGHVAGPGMDAPTITVPVTTAQRLLDERGWDDVAFVKMDIEGSEVAALRGMPGLLAQPAPPPIVFESNGHTLHLLGETPAAVRTLLAGAGYRCWLLRPPILVPVEPTELQPDCNVDYLATRTGVDRLDGWEPAPPMTAGERLAGVLASCRADHPHLRAYIARTLRTAGDEVLADARVRQALDGLTRDASPDVRSAAAWWSDRAPS
jgi:FkbM family methyltransferase